MKTLDRQYTGAGSQRYFEGPRAFRELLTMGLLVGMMGTGRLEAAELSVGNATMQPGTTAQVVVSGNIAGESTVGVTIQVEIVPRTGNIGTVTFTLAPPVDVIQLGDPWPTLGTFTAFDTDQTFSQTLNGSVDDKGEFTPALVTFTGPLTGFPVIASADADGIWDVLLSTSAGTSSWESLATTLTAGTITVTSAGCVIDTDCNDGVACTNDTCVSGSCVFTANDANCDDGLFCNGTETCDPVLGCQAGADPCAGRPCDETSNACSPPPTLNVEELTLQPGTTANVVVSGSIDGDSTFGVSLFVEIVPRLGNTGTVIFTPAPPTDIVQASDPWPGVGTFTPFDTDSTGSSLLNGSTDDNGTPVPSPVTFSEPLVGFPVEASADAGGVWDVVLTTTAGISGWEGVPTTLTAGTITVLPPVGLTVSSFAMPPDAIANLVVSGNVDNQSTFGVTIMLELAPRAGSVGTLTFTATPPVDVFQIADPWPGTGLFTSFDTDTTGSLLLNGSVDDSGSLPSLLNFSGVLTGFPVVASPGAAGVWDVTLTTSVGVSSWEVLATVLIDGTITVTPGACLTDVDCDDGNVCTDDICVAGTCEHLNNTALCNDANACTGNDVCGGGVCAGVPIPDGAACDDGNPCNVGETCLAGVCQGGGPPDCSAFGDDCNQASCDPAGLEGNCDILTPINESLPCNDANPCNVGETCLGGLCQGSTLVDCAGAGDQCTTASCDPAGLEGNCDILTPTNEGLACDDGDPCILGEACASGLCQGGVPPDCSGAGDQCNTASCDPVGLVGNCDLLTPSNEGGPCDDGNPCNVGETCQLGVCTGGSPQDCLSAGDQCNTALCDPAGVNGNCDILTPVLDGTNCDDGALCTVNDACFAGICSGAPTDCSPLNDTCNVGKCDPLTGNCQAQPANEGGVCDDGFPCTLNDVCSNGTCSGTLLDPPTVNLSWSPASQIVFVGQNVQIDLIASSGTCLNQPVASIDVILNWDHTILELVGKTDTGPFLWSSSGFPNDAFLDGLNAPFKGVPANDGDALYQVIADFQTGANVTPLGLVVTSFDFLALGGTPGTQIVIPATPGPDTVTRTRVLAAGPSQGLDVTGTLGSATVQINDCEMAADCNDGNVCTTDVCNAGLCEFTKNLLPCNDGLFCTAIDTCAGGVCVGSSDPCLAPLLCSEVLDACVECLSAADCDDGNVCTDDICNSFGTCENPNNTVPCDDGLFCTATDTCSGGVCIGSGDACPGQVCDEANDRCVECLTAGDCDDGNVCTDDFCTVANVCEHLPNILPCNDGLFCTAIDTCVNSACVGSGDPCLPPSLCSEDFNACVQCLEDTDCDDGDICTTDACLFGTCSITNNTLPCDDGLFCTATDTCSNGVCVGTGDACPGLLCDEVNDVCVECFTVADCLDDGIGCTVDTCDGGVCVHTPTDAFCDDGLFCTGAEFCSSVLGCVTPGNPCDDPALCDEALDLCGCREPLLVAEGSRYLSVTPRPGSTPVALRVTGVTPEVSCVVLFVQSDGTLDNTPVFKPPAGWGTVHVHDVEIRPSATYAVQTQCETGAGLDFSTPASASTSIWGDAVGVFDVNAMEWTPPNGIANIVDVLAIVDRFVNALTAPSVYRADLIGVGPQGPECLPDQLVNILDVLSAVDAFVGLPFPCAAPCP